jgi:hypothetical protein
MGNKKILKYPCFEPASNTSEHRVDIRETFGEISSPLLISGLINTVYYEYSIYTLRVIR